MPLLIFLHILNPLAEHLQDVLLFMYSLLFPKFFKIAGKIKERITVK